MLVYEYTNPNASKRRVSIFLSYGGLSAIKAHPIPIAGDVYTQATNIEDERNGLIGFHSGELDVPAGLLHSEPGQPG